MRLSLAMLLLGVLVVAGCGSSGSRSEKAATPAAGSLDALWHAHGQAVAMVEGTEDYAVGDVRLSFLVVARDGKSVLRPRARIWVARGLKAVPFTTGTATLERVGVPGGTADPGDVTHLYATRVRIAKAGTYFVLAAPDGGRPVRALGNLVVKKRSASPSLGSKAPASKTPTLASAHGNVAALTTRTPPDLALLHTSVADALRQHRPFVLLFATPKFCTSRTCGPITDVVEGAARRHVAGRTRFIHVEIFRDNDPTKGTNRWVKEWRLPSEPWTFLVGSNGRIAQKFEGSISTRELESALTVLR